MKKSDRLITLAILTFLAMIIGVNVVLSFRVRDGLIEGRRQLLTSQSVSHSTRPVHTLILDGTVWVNIIPADSDAVSFPTNIAEGREGSSVMPEFRLVGDSLLIKGPNTGVTHRSETDWNYTQGFGQIDVYASALEHVRISNGQAVLKGGDDSIRGQRISVDAINATVWLGELRSVSYFRRGQFDLTNSWLVLNKTCHADSLKGWLREGSEVYDKSAAIGQTTLTISDDSKILMTGSNLLHTSIFKY